MYIVSVKVQTVTPFVDGRCLQILDLKPQSILVH